MINRDQWLNALTEVGLAYDDDPDAITINEFAAMIGTQRIAAKTRLDALVAAGKATRTRKNNAIAYRLVNVGDTNAGKGRARQSDVGRRRRSV